MMAATTPPLAARRTRPCQMAGRIVKERMKTYQRAGEKRTKNETNSRF